ncbi:hypothetical protein HYFRA_00004155 [Hymenoscyphus fraxineus]|uniref:Malate dehydrogenase n=1 Tax=Hymenoscyphus fraxineus TaxID=746836 RepID=A0A9N9KPN6_9HELO|nr:hypothetical protein HYFRA_00004155 [Hymenoscyphus fraxineus]
MPSLRIIIQGLALSSMMVMTAAAPFPPIVEKVDVDDACGNASVPPTTSKPEGPTASAVPKIPASGATPDLNVTTLTLAYVTLGHGVQNYSCDAVGATGKAIGAIAKLYDVTNLAYTDIEMVHKLSAMVVEGQATEEGSEIAIKSAAAKLNAPMIGNHYFDSAGVPVFNLSEKDKIIFAAKTENVKAPATADKGPLKTGAVDWLRLVKKENYTFASKGIQEVYRLETAGGVSSACNATGVISVPYAAEYWFYN